MIDYLGGTTEIYRWLWYLACFLSGLKIGDWIGRLIYYGRR